LEVYVILYVLGGPAMALSAISIAALSVFIKSSTFFIPGSLGTQDGGNLLLLKAFGYSDVTGITFALVRRFRELVWIGVGLLCLAMQRRQGQAKKTGAHDSGSAPDVLLLPPVAPARPRARLDQNLVTVSSDDRETRD
jgi:glycosyltransferase 2 family protein